MKTWAVQDAKSRFSELLDSCVSEGSQVVSRRGVETAVLVPIAEWRRLNEGARASLKSLLLTDVGRAEFEVPARGNAVRRTIENMR